MREMVERALIKIADVSFGPLSGSGGNDVTLAGTYELVRCDSRIVSVQKLVYVRIQSSSSQNHRLHHTSSSTTIELAVMTKMASRPAATAAFLLLVAASGIAPILSTSAAGRPQLSINVRDGDFSGIGGLEPALTWEGTSKYGDMEVDYGIDVAAQQTSDITTIPRRIWGRARQRIANWDVAARADLDSRSGDTAIVAIDAGNDDLDLKIRLDGRGGLAGRDFALDRIQAVKGLENDHGNRLVINPRYNLATREADVVLAWKTGDIDIEVIASADSQRVKLSKRIDDDNWVSPVVDSKGDVSLEWDHRIDDQSAFTAKIKPQDSIDVKWKDKDWTASVNMPVDGSDVSGANVHISRQVKF